MDFEKPSQPQIDKERAETSSLVRKPQEFDSSTWTGRGASPEKSPELKTEEVAKETETVPAATETREGILSGFLLRASERAKRIEAFPSKIAEKLIGKGKEAVDAGSAICAKCKEKIGKANRGFQDTWQKGKENTQNRLTALDKKGVEMALHINAAIGDRVLKVWNYFPAKRLERRSRLAGEQTKTIEARGKETQNKYTADIAALEVQEASIKERIAALKELQSAEREVNREEFEEAYAQVIDFGLQAQEKRNAVSNSRKKLLELKKAA